MSRTYREEAVQCPCECGIQNIEHVMSPCEYMVVYLDEMIDTVDAAMQSEPETVQRGWLLAQSVGERVAAIVGTKTYSRFRFICSHTQYAFGSTLRCYVGVVQSGHILFLANSV